MTDRRSHDRGFYEIAARVTFWVLVAGCLGFGVFLVSAVYELDSPWPIFTVVGVLGGGALWWVYIGERRRRELDQSPSPICCPNCRFLTATPSGFCPRCNAKIPSQRCRKCGYDLRGNTTGACSECGMQWDAPPGTFRCTWSDCNQPNPTGTLTCQHCGREIAEPLPMTEEELREQRKRTRFLLFGYFGFLPWPLDFVLAALAVAILVVIGMFLLIALFIH